MEYQIMITADLLITITVAFRSTPVMIPGSGLEVEIIIRFQWYNYFDVSKMNVRKAWFAGPTVTAIILI